MPRFVVVHLPRCSAFCRDVLWFDVVYAWCVWHIVPRSGVVYLLCYFSSGVGCRLAWCSAVRRDVSAIVFCGLAKCIYHGVLLSGVVYLPWCFAFCRGISTVVFCGLARCICSVVPRSGEVYMQCCSAVWRGVYAVLFRGLARCICSVVPRSGVKYLP